MNMISYLRLKSTGRWPSFPPLLHSAVVLRAYHIQDDLESRIIYSPYTRDCSNLCTRLEYLYFREEKSLKDF